MKRMILIASAFLCLVATHVLHADIYKWVDENGVIRYSNRPPPEKSKAEKVFEEKRQPQPPKGETEETTVSKNTNKELEDKKRSDFFSEAKSAYRALKGLEAQIETGAKYATFRDALVEGKVEVDLFLQKHGNSAMPNLLDHLKTSLMAYEVAAKIWRQQFKTAEDFFNTRNPAISRSEALVNRVHLTQEELDTYSALFPILRSENLWLDAGVLSGSRGFTTDYTNVSRDLALRALFTEASRELESAYAELTRQK